MLVSVSCLLPSCRKREKQLEEELKKASEEREVPLGKPRTASVDKKRHSKSGGGGAEAKLSDEAPGPSICPATALCSIVSEM